MEIGIAVGVAWFGAIIIAHLTVLWTTESSVRPRISQIVFLVGVIGILLTLILLSVGLGKASVSNTALVFWALAAILTYGALLALYLPLYYSIVASLSLQSLILLSKEPRGSLPIAELRQYFASLPLVEKRLATMATNGFLIKQGDAYVLSAKGRSTAIIFSWIKTFWRLGPGG